MAAEIKKILNYSQGLNGVVLIIYLGRCVPKITLICTVFEINNIVHMCQNSRCHLKFGQVSTCQRSKRSSTQYPLLAPNPSISDGFRDKQHFPFPVKIQDGS